MFRTLILCSVMVAVFAEASHADERHIVTGHVSTEQYSAMLFGAPPPAPEVRTRGIHLRDEAAPQPVVAEPKPEARVVVQPVNFANNSAEIPAGLKADLVNLAAAMHKPEAQGKLLLITGHTDAKGSADYNLILSMRRAQAVEGFLVSLGVSRNQVISAGRGMTQPLPGKSAMDPENRRVEFKVTAG